MLDRNIRIPTHNCVHPSKQFSKYSLCQQILRNCPCSESKAENEGSCFSEPWFWFTPHLNCTAPQRGIVATLAASSSVKPDHYSLELNVLSTLVLKVNILLGHLVWGLSRRRGKQGMTNEWMMNEWTISFKALCFFWVDSRFTKANTNRMAVRCFVAPKKFKSFPLNKFK